MYADAYQKLYKIRADFSSYSKDYFVVDRGQCAALLVVRGEEALLVRQYRFVVNRVTFEVPSGKVDDGESPVDAAVRECIEETGIRALSPKPLLNYHIAADTFRLPTHIFVSHEHSEAGALPRVWTPLGRCLDMIHSGEIVDSLSIIALLAYSRLSTK